MLSRNLWCLSFHGVHCIVGKLSLTTSTMVAYKHIQGMDVEVSDIQLDGFRPLVCMKRGSVLDPMFGDRRDR